MKEKVLVRKLKLPAFVLCLVFAFATARGGDMGNPGYQPTPTPTPESDSPAPDGGGSESLTFSEFVGDVLDALGL